MAFTHTIRVRYGVPPWLFPSLWLWTWRRLFGTSDRGYIRYADFEFLRWFERTNKASLGIEHNATARDAHDRLLVKCQQFPELHLAIVDAVLATGEAGDADDARELDSLLREAGSLWRVDVSHTPPALVRRVDETMEAVVMTEAQRGDAPGRLLAMAWRTVFGRDPNASEAYRHAVRAVEAVAGPIVLPRDNERTLGKVIAHLRDAEGVWRFTLKGRADEAESVRPVRAMMATLWTSQYDRHVTDGLPLHVSPEEAETAVTLSAALVHWFSSGAVSGVE